MLIYRKPMILQHDLQMVGVPHVFCCGGGVLKMGDPRVTMIWDTPMTWETSISSTSWVYKPHYYL